MHKFSIFLAALLMALSLSAFSCSPETYTFDGENEAQESGQSYDTASDVGQKQLTGEGEVDENSIVVGPTMTIGEDSEPMSDSLSKEGPTALMKTNKGDVKIQLFQKATPETVGNFIKLAEQNFYDGTQFHRVIPDFMIQGGDPTTKEQPDNFAIHGTGGPGYTFPDEFSDHKNVRGRLSMANSGPNTNGSQFFIITAEATPWLDGRHAVFGEVIEGMDVIDSISGVKTNDNDHPLEPVIIEDVIIQS